MIFVESCSIKVYYLLPKAQVAVVIEITATTILPLYESHVTVIIILAFLDNVVVVEKQILVIGPTVCLK